MDWVQLTTILVAAYGAGLSTIIYFKNKPKLIIEHSVALIEVDGKLKPFFTIKTSNRTKHRMVLNHVGICFKNDMTFIPEGIENSQKELLSGSSHTTLIDIKKIVKAIEDNGDIKYVFSKDATGREYRGYSKKIRRTVVNTLEIFENRN